MCAIIGIRRVNIGGEIHPPPKQKEKIEKKTVYNYLFIFLFLNKELDSILYYFTIKPFIRNPFGG